MGMTSLLVTTFKLVLITALPFVLITFIPGLPPDIPFEKFQLPPARSLEGALKPNGILDKAELILAKEIFGPESISVDGDTIYFGASEGEGSPSSVYKYDGSLHKIAQIGEHCDFAWEPSKCGFPLGTRLSHDKKHLFLVDAFKGVYKINVTSGEVQQLIKYGAKIDGIPVGYPDDLDVGSDGSIYWSDASKGGPEETLPIMLGVIPTGRLIKTDLKTGKSQVLLNKLYFANGVQLSPNEDFVLVCESFSHRVRRYYLKGPKKGTDDLFVDRLPGSPDNIRPNGKGGYYISIVTMREDLEVVMERPLLRKMVLRLDALLKTGINFLEQYFPRNHYLGWALLQIRNIGITLHDPTKKIIIVETDGEGKVIGSLQSEKSQITFISQATVGDRYIYFGGPFTRGIYRLDKKLLSKS